MPEITALPQIHFIMRPVLIGLVFLSANLFSADTSADIFVRDDIITDPDRNRFSMCHGQGCREVKQLSLNDLEWQNISRHFSEPAQSAEQERQQIASAIAEFEQIVGRKTGTSADRAGLFSAMGTAGQLDCIDESTNTTTYLNILYRHELLKWHEPIDHITRGFFILGWPHSSGAIREVTTGENNEIREFAVDSWFEDNGRRPHIVPVSQWRWGWKPQ